MSSKQGTDHPKPRMTANREIISQLDQEGVIQAEDRRGRSRSTTYEPRRPSVSARSTSSAVPEPQPAPSTTTEKHDAAPGTDPLTGKVLVTPRTAIRPPSPSVSRSAASAASPPAVHPEHVAWAFPPQEAPASAEGDSRSQPAHAAAPPTDDAREPARPSSRDDTDGATSSQHPVPPAPTKPPSPPGAWPASSEPATDGAPRATTSRAPRPPTTGIDPSITERLRREDPEGTGKASSPFFGLPTHRTSHLAVYYTLGWDGPAVAEEEMTEMTLRLTAPGFFPTCQIVLPLESLVEDLHRQRARQEEGLRKDQTIQKEMVRTKTRTSKPSVHSKPRSTSKSASAELCSA
ncbi:hypothetical protein AURDEDRAFT_188960 [Auricularia subglabra TFB-10046 SS5]|nr:hypothetical protein AURDEDRAFT_188960 [Auricularia subglabra TFB-10046 SS5]